MDESFSPKRESCSSAMSFSTSPKKRAYSSISLDQTEKILQKDICESLSNRISMLEMHETMINDLKQRFKVEFKSSKEINDSIKKSIFQMQNTFINAYGPIELATKASIQHMVSNVLAVVVNKFKDDNQKNSKKIHLVAESSELIEFQEQGKMDFFIKKKLIKSCSRDLIILIVEVKKSNLEQGIAQICLYMSSVIKNREDNQTPYPIFGIVTLGSSWMLVKLDQPDGDFQFTENFSVFDQPVTNLGEDQWIKSKGLIVDVIYDSLYYLLDL